MRLRGALVRRLRASCRQRWLHVQIWKKKGTSREKGVWSLEFGVWSLWRRLILWIFKGWSCWNSHGFKSVEELTLGNTIWKLWIHLFSRVHTYTCVTDFPCTVSLNWITVISLLNTIPTIEMYDANLIIGAIPSIHILQQPIIQSFILEIGVFADLYLSRGQHASVSQTRERIPSLHFLRELRGYVFFRLVSIQRERRNKSLSINWKLKTPHHVLFVIVIHHAFSHCHCYSSGCGSVYCVQCFCSDYWCLSAKGERRHYIIIFMMRRLLHRGAVLFS